MKRTIITLGLVSLMSSCGIQMGNYERWKEVHGKDQCLNEIQRSIDEIEYYVKEDVNNGNMREDISVFYMREITNIQAYLQNLKSIQETKELSQDEYYDYLVTTGCENCDEID